MIPPVLLPEMFGDNMFVQLGGIETTKTRKAGTNFRNPKWWEVPGNSLDQLSAGCVPGQNSMMLMMMMTIMTFFSLQHPIIWGGKPQKFKRLIIELQTDDEAEADCEADGSGMQESEPMESVSDDDLGPCNTGWPFASLKELLNGIASTDDFLKAEAATAILPRSKWPSLRIRIQPLFLGAKPGDHRFAPPFGSQDVEGTFPKALGISSG